MTATPAAGAVEAPLVIELKSLTTAAAQAAAPALTAAMQLPAATAASTLSASAARAEQRARASRFSAVVGGRPQHRHLQQHLQQSHAQQAQHAARPPVISRTARLANVVARIACTNAATQSTSPAAIPRPKARYEAPVKMVGPKNKNAPPTTT